MANPQTKQPEKKCTVRLAKATDIPQVIAIDAENTGLSKGEYWQDLFDRYNNRPTNSDDDAPNKSANRYRFFLIASDADSVLGFIIGEVRAWEFGSPPCGWVFAVGVRDQIRQGGVGATLFEALCDRFRKAGVNKVRTMLARDHTLIMSFFRSQGMMAGPFIELEKDL
jgi:ribosomal protein S18 acetylase RimI-like enzyme